MTTRVITAHFTRRYSYDCQFMLRTTHHELLFEHTFLESYSDHRCGANQSYQIDQSSAFGSIAEWTGLDWSMVKALGIVAWPTQAERHYSTIVRPRELTPLSWILYMASSNGQESHKTSRCAFSTSALPIPDRVLRNTSLLNYHWWQSVWYIEYISTPSS